MRLRGLPDRAAELGPLFEDGRPDGTSRHHYTHYTLFVRRGHPGIRKIILARPFLLPCLLTR